MSDTPPPAAATDPSPGDAAAARPVTDATPPPSAAASPGAPGDDAPGDDSDDAAPDVTALLVQVVTDSPRPLTGFEIARAVERTAPGVLAAREGYVYPLLHELRRRGRIEARWGNDESGRSRRYALPGATWPDEPAPGTARPPRTPSAEIRAFADAATDRLDFAPRVGEEARAELLEHVLAASAALESGGRTRDDADAEALRAMGDPWKISADLSRAARGLRTVVFPRSAAESLLSLAIYDAGILLAIVAAVVFVRAQVVAAYHIPTKSMEPTLHGDREGGDRILVFSLAPPPARFDIEVFEGWLDDRKQYVKRCIGLPGEEVKLFEGDLWIDGNLVRKDGAALDAMLFPLFDLATERRAARREHRTAAESLKDRWIWDGGTEWLQWPEGDFEARVDDGSEPAELRWRDRVTDALYDEATGETSDGVKDVADGRITVDVTPADAASRVVVRWARGAERYDAVLCGEEPGVAIFVDGAEVVRDRSVVLPAGRASRVRFSSVDRVLRLDVDGRAVLRHDLPAPSQPKRDGPSADVSVRVSRGKAKLTPVRLERDVHWTSEYEGADRPRLGPDEYFMLGDNSSNSQDSRARGPVHRGRLVGSPLLIVWPPARFGVPR